MSERGASQGDERVRQLEAQNRRLREVEGELREERARLQLILHGTGIGLWDWDLTTNRVWYSAEWKRQIGYEDKEIGSDFAEWERRVHPDDRGPTTQRLRAYVADPRGEHEIEFRFRHRDGSYRWIQARGTILRDNAGMPVRMLGTHLDVTDNRQLVDEARTARQRAATILESISDGFVGLGFDWCYSYVNARGAELLGRRPEELIGRHIWTEFPTGLGQPFHHAYERAMADRVPIQLRQYYEPWGRWFENRIYPTPDGIAIYFTEITDQVLAEQVVEESERRLRDIMDSMFVFVGLLSLDGRIVEVNRAPLAAAGLARDGVIGRPVWETYWFGSSEGAQARVREALQRAARGETVRYDEQLRVAADRLLDMDITFGPLRDRSGAVTGIVGSAVDVTERRTAERVLEQTATRLRMFVEHAPAALAMFDRDMRYLAVSRRWLSDYGLANRDIIGRLHYDVFPEISGSWKEAHRQGLAGAVIREEEDRLARADGTEQWLRWEVRPWRDPGGAVGGILIFSEDITHDKVAERLLREGEERLRLALEAAQMGTFDWDMVSDRIVWSRSHEELWGYAPGEFDGTYAAFAARIHPDDLPPLGREVARCIAERALFERDYRVVRPDGVVRWILSHGEAEFDARGTPVRLRGVVRDITERKEHEASLRLSGERLQALTERLEHVLEHERTRISREIHDELGQMLTGIRMDLRWVERWLDERFSDDVRINPVLDRLVIVSELTDNITRKVQRIAAELRPGILDKLGLGAALQYEADGFTERFGIACEVDTPAEEPQLPPDVTTALFRIFQEALTNVARHSKASKVDVRFDISGSGCLLEIRDDGGGAKARPGGAALMSLGLLGMEERARLAGGRASFASPPGGGFAVRVEIPLQGLGTA